MSTTHLVLSRHKALHVIALCLATVLCLITGSAQAITWQDPPTFEKIIDQSSLAARGVVVDVIYHNLDSDGTPFTEIVLRVDHAYLGATKGQFVTFHQFGGYTLDGRWREIVGIPTYERGDHVAVFLNDRVQRSFFGTLYADLGIRRFGHWNGRTLALSNNWRPLLKSDPSKVGAAESQSVERNRCEPLAGDRGQCAGWHSEEKQWVGGPTGPDKSSRADQRLMTADEFDRLVEQRVATTGSSADKRGPAQTLKHTVDFRASLESFVQDLGESKTVGKDARDLQ